MKKTHLTIGILILVILIGGVFFVTTSPLPRRQAGLTSLLEGERNRTNEHLPISASLKLENGQKIGLRVVNTPETRQRGLSGFKKLEHDEGMLFVFDEPGVYPFWMKDMQFPIDIIWLRKITDQEYGIIHIEKNVAPETFPQSFVSSEFADIVLEVNSGFGSVNNLDYGDVVWITFQE